MVAANLINKYQLDELLSYQKNLDEWTPLGRLTVELGLVNEEEFTEFLASYFDVPYLDLENFFSVHEDVLNLVPQSIARRLNIMPVLKKDDTLTVAMSDPLDLTAVNDLETITRCRIKRVVSPPGQIRQSIRLFYNCQYEEPPVVYERKIREDRQSAPALIRMLVEKAYKNDVKNVHIQQEKNRIEILFRAAGRLEKVASYPKTIMEPLSKFIKRSACLKEISEAPQSGSFKYASGSIAFEIGISVLPTVTGERIVLEVPKAV